MDANNKYILKMRQKNVHHMSKNYHDQSRSIVENYNANMIPEYSRNAPIQTVGHTRDDPPPINVMDKRNHSINTRAQ